MLVDKLWKRRWIKMNERMTIKNPNGTYRIPIERAKGFTVESLGQSVTIRGELVDKLGAYEELGLSPEEIKRIVISGKYAKNSRLD